MIGFRVRRQGCVRLKQVVAAALMLGVGFAALFGQLASTSAMAMDSGQATVPIQYAGVDYVDPSEYFTHCPDFSWLQSSCWDNPSKADPARRQLISDLSFVHSHNMVGTERVWISLDQLIRWRKGSGFIGFRSGVLRHVDDMLSLYGRYGVRVILVLFVYDDSGHLNEFRPWALDGYHSKVRSGYLTALKELLRHLSQNPTDVSTAPIIELANEPYYQLEMYFNNPAHLGRFRGCAGSGRTNWQCVDQMIVHPWLESLYNTARAASHAFLYTFSDTTRLFANYAYWSKMYPEDIIDEHLYDTHPGAQASIWARAKGFELPWIASEVGCNVGDVSCTYNGTAAAQPDSWWLRNLDRDGAQAVLVDSHVTLWHYPSGPNSQQATLTGESVQQATNAHLGPSFADSK